LGGTIERPPCPDLSDEEYAQLITDEDYRDETEARHQAL
jgi:hypothetical protein